MSKIYQSILGLANLRLPLVMTFWNAIQNLLRKPQVQFGWYEVVCSNLNCTLFLQLLELNTNNFPWPNVTWSLSRVTHRGGLAYCQLDYHLRSIRVFLSP